MLSPSKLDGKAPNKYMKNRLDFLERALMNSFIISLQGFGMNPTKKKKLVLVWRPILPDYECYGVHLLNLPTKLHVIIYIVNILGEFLKVAQPL